MHASVRIYQAVDVEKLLEKVESEFVDRVKTIDGLIDYYVIDSGDGTVTAMTLGKTVHAVDASTRMAEAWVVERAAYLVAGHPNVTVGEVRVRAEP
jgi:hypothetical protein